MCNTVSCMALKSTQKCREFDSRVRCSSLTTHVQVWVTNWRAYLSCNDGFSGQCGRAVDVRSKLACFKPLQRHRVVAQHQSRWTPEAASEKMKENGSIYIGEIRVGQEDAGIAVDELPSTRFSYTRQHHQHTRRPDCEEDGIQRRCTQAGPCTCGCSCRGKGSTGRPTRSP